MKGYIKFNHVGNTASGKTGIWEVLTTLADDFLGTIKWSAPWRRYIFHADAECSFDATCLRKIANFCDKLMAERKKVAQ